MDKLTSENLSFVFATKEDQRLIYEMLVSPETIDMMFNEDHPAPTWEEFSEEEESYLTGQAHPHGSYLLIIHEDEVIGSISYACEYEKTPYCELDLWMKSTRFTGRGFGPEALQTVIAYVRKTFGITIFMIRPWARNYYAVKAYKKCGFEENPSMHIEDFYSDEHLKKYGDGDYGVEETVTLFLVWEHE